MDKITDTFKKKDNKLPSDNILFVLHKIIEIAMCISHGSRVKNEGFSWKIIRTRGVNKKV